MPPTATSGSQSTEQRTQTSPEPPVRPFTIRLGDAGKTLQVRVSFTDDHGYTESLTSAATSTVTCHSPSTPTEIAVTAVPIVVTSTENDYFVLYAKFDVGGTTVEYPVLMKLGEEGTTTLAENVEALPADRYRVEKYLVASPGDVDGDCADDITEINNLPAMNPVNPGATVNAQRRCLGDSRPGDLRVARVHMGERQAFRQVHHCGCRHRSSKHLLHEHEQQPAPQQFHEQHGSSRMRGSSEVRFLYEPTLTAPDGSLGIYLYRFPFFNESFSLGERLYALLSASMPAVDNDLALWMTNGKLPAYQDDLPSYRESRLDVLFDDDVRRDVDFVGLNQAEGYGVLRSLEAGERPHPRDVVIYEVLPNDLAPCRRHSQHRAADASVARQSASGAGWCSQRLRPRRSRRRRHR